MVRALIGELGTSSPAMRCSEGAISQAPFLRKSILMPAGRWKKSCEGWKVTSNLMIELGEKE